MNRLRRFLPFLAWPRPSGAVLRGDAVAGITVGLMVVPQGVAYACLAEAALLAMEERFECFTLGRDVHPDRVKQIYRLFRKHESSGRPSTRPEPLRRRVPISATSSAALLSTSYAP